MQIAILNDTHAGVRNSSDIFIDYQRRFYEEIFFPYLLENDIKHIVHLGDYYEHRRFINFKALSSNRKHFLDKLREYGITMDIIPGNHDTYYKNTNELNSLKELLGHYMNEVSIIQDPTVMDYDGLKFGLVPWICQENEREIHDFLINCKADMIGGHFELAGFDMMRGVPCTSGMSAENLRRFETVLSGHYHCKSSQGNIHYLGSQMEFFWSDAGDDKFFHILNTDTRELTPVRNPLTLYEKLYYDDENTDYSTKDVSHLDGKFVKVVVTNKTDSFTFDRFLDRIQQRDILDLKIQENFESLLGDNVSDEGLEVEDTQELLRGYVDNIVDTNLDKERLKKELIDLMIESETLELA
jgi:DNA repair exonuclease SbcCD nuclease subunit